MKISKLLFFFTCLFADEGNMNPNYIHAFHSQGSKDHELSTLPSPSSSVVDLDSNAGTVETEVLLSSFKGSHTSSPGIHLFENFYYSRSIEYF